MSIKGKNIEQTPYNAVVLSYSCFDAQQLLLVPTDIQETRPNILEFALGFSFQKATPGCLHHEGGGGVDETLGRKLSKQK